MSVSERRMFFLIWWLGGGLIGEAGGADVGGCAGLEDEEWLDGAEDTGDDGTFEELDLVSASFCWGCFLGMVKLHLVTRSAPVMWTGPGGNGDGAGAGAEPVFLDFTAVLVGVVAGFFDAFELAAEEVFLVLEETFSALVGGDFLFRLLGVSDAVDFSEDGICSFSFCFSSLGGAGNQEEKPNILQIMAQHSKHLQSLIMWVTLFSRQIAWEVFIYHFPTSQKKTNTKDKTPLVIVKLRVN